ncbi:MAG: hypothetical protein ACE147_15425 [Candidatus Methylomirabilales bacterium]
MSQDPGGALERLLTRLGLWGGLRAAGPVSAAILAGVVLLEVLTPSAARLFPRVSANALHFLAVGLGLLLGLLGHFAADAWDRRLFPAWYGEGGRWRAATTPPLLVLPPGAPIAAARAAAAPGLPRKPQAGADFEREAVKQARRQVERWARIERPLILSHVVRGLLWPALAAAVLAAGGAIAAPPAGVPAAAPRLLAVAGGCAVLAALLLVPYTRLRAEYLLRLYTDIAAHVPRKKSERH